MQRLSCLLFAVALVACSSDGLFSSEAEEAEAIAPDSAVGGGDVVSASRSGVHPRWVLYDGGGEAVRAIVTGVSHSRAPSQKPNPQDGETYDPLNPPHDQCVYLSAIEGRRLMKPARFELASGEMAPCYQERELSRYYLNSNCSGDVYYRRAPKILKIEGQMYWTKGKVRRVETAYTRYGDGTCGEQHPNPPDGHDDAKGIVYPLESAPDWLTGALDNPPYEVRPAY